LAIILSKVLCSKKYPKIRKNTENWEKYRKVRKNAEKGKIGVRPKNKKKVLTQMWGKS